MEEILNYIKKFKGKQGLYIIRPKSQEILKLICQKLNYEYTSDIAYIGKAELTKTSHLALRAKQEMGWSNFEGATFVRKMGCYLDFDIKDKKIKNLKNKLKCLSVLILQLNVFLLKKVLMFSKKKLNISNASSLV